MIFEFFLITILLNLTGDSKSSRHHQNFHAETVRFEEQISPSFCLDVEATFYCNCPECCGQWAEIGLTASGTIPVEGKTIAVDPEVIPLGSEIIFLKVPTGMEYLQTNPDGSEKIFCAEDTGNRDYISGQRIDIFLNDHDLANQLGVKNFTIEVVPK